MHSPGPEGELRAPREQAERAGGWRRRVRGSRSDAVSLVPLRTADNAQLEADPSLPDAGAAAAAAPTAKARAFGAFMIGANFAKRGLKATIAKGAEMRAELHKSERYMALRSKFKDTFSALPLGVQAFLTNPSIDEIIAHPEHLFRQFESWQTSSERRVACKAGGARTSSCSLGAVCACVCVCVIGRRGRPPERDQSPREGVVRGRLVGEFGRGCGVRGCLEGRRRAPRWTTGTPCRSIGQCRGHHQQICARTWIGARTSSHLGFNANGSVCTAEAISDPSPSRTTRAVAHFFHCARLCLFALSSSYQPPLEPLAHPSISVQLLTTPLRAPPRRT